MIEDYRGLAIFVAIADAGSLSEAGRRLELSTSVVSHHLSRLEGKLGMSLFFRSTRSMTLTAEGLAALEPARRMVAAGEEALELFRAGTDEPVGALRITMPAWGERMRLRQKIWDFARLYPRVALKLQNSDAQVDLIRDGFDLAIRLGRLADSGLKSRRITDFKRVLVASPDYLAARSPIETVDDLASCDFVSITPLPDTVTLTREDESVTFKPERIRLEVDTVGAARSAIAAGLGIRQLPLGEVDQALASGELVQVLPHWTVSKLGLYVVWPDAGPQKALTRRLIDFILDDRDNLVP